jgi:hypothetical protein
VQTDRTCMSALQATPPSPPLGPHPRAGAAHRPSSAVLCEGSGVWGV